MTVEFYEFSQNNSGGGFDVDDKLCHRLFIEAEDSDSANEIAKTLGVYFDGVDKGDDCNCCGDRWSEAYGPFDLERINANGYEVTVFERRNGDSAEKRWKEQYGNYAIHEEPRWVKKTWRGYTGKIKFRNIEEYAQFLTDEYGWTTPDTRIYYIDGTVAEINKTKGRR